jgi:ElaB/YqjD/DUF883 family membrane-anchored ribosome-binding protein
MMKPTRHHPAQTPDELLEQINELMSETEAMLVGPSTHGTSHHLDEMRSRLAAAQDHFEDLCRLAGRKVASSAKFADRTIRIHPYESVAVALGIGVLLGAFTRRDR